MNFHAIFAEIFAELEDAAAEAGAGYEARAGDGEVRLQTTDGRQKLVFRRDGAHLAVVFYDQDLSSERWNAREGTFVLGLARARDVARTLIARWLEAYGPR